MRRDKGRVFVGLDGSLESMEALCRGVWEARRRDTELLAVHVRPFSLSKGYDFGFSEAASRTEVMDREADDSIARWLQDGLGQVPSGISVIRRVAVGEVGASLVRMAPRADDLIVLGASRGGRLRHLFGNKTRKYCVDRAACSVLVVSPPRLAQELKRGGMLRTSAHGCDLWDQFESETMRPPRMP